MLTELTLGALVAIASPQEHKIEIDLRIPAVRAEISELQTVLPDLDIHVPEVDMAIPGLDLHLRGSDVEEYQEVDTDTTFEVNPKAVLGVRNHAGAIVIRTWERNRVRVQARHSSRDRVKILDSESSVRIKSEARFGHPDVVDYEITIPGTMPLDLWGFYSDISVEGAGGGVRAETLNGDIQIRNSAGEISLRSVEGGVTVQRSQGRLEVNNVENEISILEFQGDLFIESIDGDIRLEGIQSRNVDAKTVDGTIRYSGDITDDGRYRLTTHDGDVILAIPENANAMVSVATFDGEFEAAFPVTLERTEASRRFSFKLGNGAARIELHSFDGDIELVRR